MINFNIPPFTGKETEYMAKAIQNHKISGDGEFTKKCNKWIEDHTGTAPYQFVDTEQEFEKSVKALRP